jgi:dipeptidyl aminopeptidase/acylaminoacyl peptidase
VTRLGLDTFWTLPRVGSLDLSPDGRRVILSVATLAPDSKRFVTSLWELPADGSAPPRRVTYSEKGEGPHAFLPDGSLLFGSARPDVTAKDDAADGRLFRLRAGGGEAEAVLALPAGVEEIAAARGAGVAVVKTSAFPGAPGLEEDAAKAKRREEAGVSGVLFDHFPIRFWDHELGPRHARLLKVDLSAGAAAPEDLTPDFGVGLHEAAFDVSPDGSTVATTWEWNPEGVELLVDLVVLSGGGRRSLGTAAGWGTPAISPDGRWVASVEETVAHPDRVFEAKLCVFDLATGERRDLARELDLLPLEPRWAADGASIWFTADERGRGSLFNVPVQGGPPRKVAGGGPYLSVHPSPDGACVYALRSNLASPPVAVRIDASTGDESELPTPGVPLELPGRLEEITTEVDGVQVRGWLVLPEGASAERPAPLLLWVHGGPFLSWNGWSWRWCAYLMAERGYAVLMADPALSSGYGRAFIERAWDEWGAPTWRDLEAVLEAALARPDLDGNRAAAMGGSFGGYMANWIAGHTDRFRAIVSHASTWDERTFFGTTDQPHWSLHQFGDPDRDRERYEEISPRVGLDRITTPLLLIHGALDYRVPYSESLRMYVDLKARGRLVKFLSFPDENHWILKPGNARVWYETVLAFADEHLLGAGWHQPELL